MVKRKYLILVAMAGMLVSLDQLTKFVVTSRLQLGETIVVFYNFFNITQVRNSGAAFGLFSDLATGLREPLFLILPAVTVSIILLLFSRLKDNQQISIFAFSMIIGGALGNLMDRLRLGHVVDFLDFHWRNQIHFPAFNVADSAITIGVAMLFVSILFENDKRAN